MSERYDIEAFLKVTSATDPSLSPDGNWIAYLSNTTGTMQVWRVPFTGGDAQQLTAFEDPVESVQYSPRDNVMVIAKGAGGNEKLQLYLLDPETKQVTPLCVNPEVRYGIGWWSEDGTKYSYTSNERNGTDFDVYVIEITTREITCVYKDGGWCASAGFTPDGTHIVVRRAHSNVNSDLFLVNLTTGEQIHMTPHDGDVIYAGPRWSTDGQYCFLRTNQDSEYIGIARYARSDKKLERIITPEWDIEGIKYHADTDTTTYIVNEEGYMRLRIVRGVTQEPINVALPKGNVTTMDFTKEGTHLLITQASPRHNRNIYVIDLRTGETQQRTFASQGVPPDVLVEPELIRFTSFDGRSIPAFIYRPRGTSGKCPTIFYIHGGPESQFKPGLDVIVQYFVHAGYVVVAPNIRGSAGYGKTYLTLDDVEKRLDSLKDLVALREYLKDDEHVDSDRIALMGGSYGGYMVLAGLAFYPSLWAAGVDIVGIVNFVTFLENTAAYRRATREAEYGSLEHDRAVLEAVSPIRAIDDITAPLMVIHGKNDPRVPLSEAEQVVQRLRARGRAPELLVYDDEGHGISKLKNRLDAYPKVAAFLDGVLKVKI